MKKFLAAIAFLLFPLPVFAVFPDVDATHPYSNAIMNLSRQGVVNGYQDGMFLPGKVINRAEFLKIAVLAKEGKDFEPPQNQNCFPDISATDWFAPYTCYAKEKQWIKGYTDGTFGGGRYINFGEAFTMISNIFRLGIEMYSDSDWYYKAQRYFETQDLIPNIERTISFQINRGEMAEMISRTQKLPFRSTVFDGTVSYESLRMEVFDQVNEQRRANGLEPLFYSMQLEQAAQEHADTMLHGNFFAHTNPDTGTTVLDRIKSSQYDQRNAGENIAKGQQTADAVMKSWMNSAPHTKNILDPRYREMGVGIAASETGELYWVQVFGWQCEERDAMQGCMSRSEFQERNPDKYSSEFSWY